MPEIHPAFAAARDLLLRHRTDYTRAYAEFQWPRLDTFVFLGCFLVGSSRVDLQACKLEYSIVSPK